MSPTRRQDPHPIPLPTGAGFAAGVRHSAAHSLRPVYAETAFGCRRLSMKSLVVCFGLAAGLAIFASVGVADEASDYLKAAGDEADALTKCATDYVGPLLKSSESAEEL